MNGQDGSTERVGRYNPEDVAQYAGWYFEVSSHSDSDDSYRLGVTPDGRITGRGSVEGARIGRIAGLDAVGYWGALEFLAPAKPERREELDRYIEINGKKPEAGLSLALSLHREDAAEKGRNGLVSGPIKFICSHHPNKIQYGKKCVEMEQP